MLENTSPCNRGFCVWLSESRWRRSQGGRGGAGEHRVLVWPWWLSSERHTLGWRPGLVNELPVGPAIQILCQALGIQRPRRPCLPRRPAQWEVMTKIGFPSPLAKMSVRVLWEHRGGLRWGGVHQPTRPGGVVERSWWWPKCTKEAHSRAGP